MTFNQIVDYTLEVREDGYSRLSMEVQAHHLNPGGTLHGGMSSTLIDIGGWLVTPPINNGFTLNLNVNFVSPGRLGDKLSIESYRTGSGVSVFFSRTEIKNQRDELIAHGICTYKLRR